MADFTQPAAAQSTISRDELVRIIDQQTKLRPFASRLMEEGVCLFTFPAVGPLLTYCSQMVRDIKLNYISGKRVWEINYSLPINIESIIMQAVGRTAPEPCHRCSRGRGPFAGACVLVDGSDHCANCHYGGEGARCSFRNGPRKEGQRKRKRVKQDGEDDEAFPPARPTAPTAVLGLGSLMPRTPSLNPFGNIDNSINTFNQLLPLPSLLNGTPQASLASPLRYQQQDCNASSRRPQAPLALPVGRHQASPEVKIEPGLCDYIPLPARLNPFRVPPLGNPQDYRAMAR